MLKGKFETFRYAEKCLYEYPESCARLERLKDDLQMLSSSIQGQRYDVISDRNRHSDPVWQYVLKVNELEQKIAGLERRTEPIGRLIKDLEAPYILGDSPKAELLKVLELYYFGRNSSAQVTEALHLDRRRVYDRRVALVQLAIRYLGF